MSRMREVQSKKQGAALALALFAMVILLLTGVGLLGLGLQARVYAVRTSDEIAARTAADAALTRAMLVLNQKVESGCSENDLLGRTDGTLANSSATFDYQVARPGDIIAAGIPFTSSYVIKCTGRSGSAVKVVYATLRIKGLFENAILSRRKISLMPNTLVTGYNSADPTDTDIDVKIGTTSTDSHIIPLQPGTVVEGDIFVGVGGDPEKVIVDSGDGVTGDKYALTEEIELPVITPPSQLRDFGTVLGTKGETVTLRPADSGSYHEIKLSAKGHRKPGVLEITGGKVVLHLTGNIHLGKNCEITVRADSSLLLYADGDIDMGNSAGFVNENPSSAKLKIYATGQDLQAFELKAKSKVFGVVYAPNADIELYPLAELYGAIVASNVWIKSGGTFYYDAALRNAEPGDEGTSLAIAKWWE